MTKSASNLLEAEDFNIPLEAGGSLVLGDTNNPKLITVFCSAVDAVCFADAFNWLPNSFPSGVVVVGLRATSFESALADFFLNWAQRFQPQVFLIRVSDDSKRDHCNSNLDHNGTREFFANRRHDYKSDVYTGAYYIDGGIGHLAKAHEAGLLPESLIAHGGVYHYWNSECTSSKIKLCSNLSYFFSSFNQLEKCGVITNRHDPRRYYV